MQTAFEMRETANLRYDRIPIDVELQIRAQEATERRAAELGAIMLLPAEERFDALARREWSSIRLIWRGREGYIYQKTRYGHVRDPLTLRRYWRRSREETIAHLIAWRAYRDANRKFVELREAA